MDILIKGMKMKDYPQSITINPDGSVVKDTFGLHRPMDEWKAVALPEHGRLKDELDILRIFDKYLPKVDDDTNALLCEILAEIHLQAPTVLEATE